MGSQILGGIALTWYIIVILVITIGTIQLSRYFLRPCSKPISPDLPLERVPHVTIIRPVKGLEPCLYECLASTFQQTYPISKLTVNLCISSRSDPALPILERLVADYSLFDVRIYIEDDGQKHLGINDAPLGPNPKIRNMSRAYAEAKSDIVWIIDCNVWVSKSTCGLMVDSLCGLGVGKKYKFVHQLPLAVDVTSLYPQHPTPSTLSFAGGLLDEMFLSTAHAKFYTAISTVAIAPCIVGKSNMFRRSHLAALTQPSPENPTARPGIDFFSHNICEDHLVGDLLWRSAVPESVLVSAAQEGLDQGRMPWGNHAIVPAPPCIQPLANISLSSYTARRARWLRVRKFTVPSATAVEPGTESILATLMGAYGLTTVQGLGIPQTWSAFWVLWTLGMVIWCMWDRYVSSMLQNWKREGDGTEEHDIPSFVGSSARKTFWEWFYSWCGRELLAWPVWAWAVLGGTEVIWRGEKFWVGFDMKVHAVDSKEGKVA